MRRVMKNTQKIVLFGWMVGLAQVAVAFPTWMGVYSFYQRHNGRNPGTFCIMMNQDYWGLNANVGIQVNGGGWQEFPMAYETNKDGNSVWSYTPTNTFPFGAQVAYYFHGMEEGSASNIYDSAGSSNYHSGPLYWSDARLVDFLAPYPGNAPYRAKAAGDHDRVYLAAALNSSPVFTLAVQPAGQPWQDLTNLFEAATIDDFAIAATPRGAVLALVTNLTVAARVSSDFGKTYAEPVFVAPMPDGASVYGLDVVCLPNGTLALAFGVSTNCCGAQKIFYAQSTDNGASWSVPVLVDEPTTYGDYYNMLRIAQNDTGIFIIYRGVSSGASTYLRVARSLNGAAWSITSLGSNRAWSDFGVYADTNLLLVAADPYVDSVAKVFRTFNGQDWETNMVSHPLESGRTLWLGADWKKNPVLFRMEDNQDDGEFLMLASRTSTNAGAGWSDPNPVYWPPPYTVGNDTYTLRQVVAAPNNLFLLWHFDLYIGMFQRMHEIRLQTSDGFTERMGTLELTGGQLRIPYTNLVNGMVYELQRSTHFPPSSWETVATGSATNNSGVWTDAATGPGGFYRVWAPYAP